MKNLLTLTLLSISLSLCAQDTTVCLSITPKYGTRIDTIGYHTSTVEKDTIVTRYRFGLKFLPYTVATTTKVTRAIADTIHTRTFTGYDTLSAYTIAPVKYGLMFDNLTMQQRADIMQQLGVTYVRTKHALSKGETDKDDDYYYSRGFKIIVNLDISFNPVFPQTITKDTAAFRQSVRAYLTQHKEQIALVLLANEMMNPKFVNGTIEQYVTNLNIVVDESHRLGLKVADGGITSGDWRLVVNETDPSTLFNAAKRQNLINTYATIDALANTGIDYITYHVYYDDTTAIGFSSSIAKAIAKRSGKKAVCTEGGMYQNKPSIVARYISEISATNLSYFVWWSGSNSTRDSRLQDGNGKLLPSGEMFRATIK